MILGLNYSRLRRPRRKVHHLGCRRRRHADIGRHSGLLLVELLLQAINLTLHLEDLFLTILNLFANVRVLNVNLSLGTEASRNVEIRCLVIMDIFNINI